MGYQRIAKNVIERRNYRGNDLSLDHLTRLNFTTYASLTLFLLLMNIVSHRAEARHGVLDIKFPSFEELTTPSKALSQLKSIPETSPRVVIFANQLYRLRLRGLNGSSKDASFYHVASVAGYPDLPRWTFLRPHRDDLLLYGTQPNSGSVDIQIISTNQETFDVNVRQLQLQVEPRETNLLYEVEMKIINYNVEDVFEKELLPKLEKVIKALWNTSPVVFTSKLASVLDIGGRSPLDPRHKEGFVVRVGGSGDFSPELRSLELEVRQLRNRIPCPRDYKRTSAEWRFREIGVVPDWCGFRLITHWGSLAQNKSTRNELDGGRNNEASSTRSSQLAAAAASDVAIETSTSILQPREGIDRVSSSQDGNATNGFGFGGATPPIFEGPSLHDLPRRSSFEDVAVSLALPMAVCLLLLGGLSGTSLCLYASDEPSSTTESSTRRRSFETENLRRPHALRHGKN